MTMRSGYLPKDTMSMEALLRRIPAPTSYNVGMGTLLQALTESAARRPGHLAVADQSLMLSFAELHTLATKLARRIEGETGAAHVGILLPTSSLGAVALLACWYSGRVPVPLNFLLSAEELAGVVRDAELDLILTISHFAEAAKGLERATGARALMLNAQLLHESPAAAGNAESEEFANLRAECSHYPDARTECSRSPTETAVILYTSGTQGRPKGVCLSHDNLLSNARSAIEYARFGDDEVFLSILPQFHCFGLTAMTVVPLLLGATVHYLPRFSPLALLETMQERRATVFMAVASMYAALLGQKSAGREHFASLRLAISGGEALPPNVFAAFGERFGVTIYEGYGLTEASPIVSWNTTAFHRSGSVGRALPGVEVFAAEVGAAPRPATNAGRPPLPRGQTGELMVRGPTVMQGYYKQPEATAAVVRDGVLATGDVGHVDADGYIFITGRAKEMIIVGGENVYPREIENALLAHPAVAEAAAIGAPDALRGEQPVAFVILKAGANATALELRTHCRDKLAGYKVPRTVVIAEELPRGPTGKILKRALRERVAE